ncbi:hypothetical protein Tco_1258740, partial [Tanacetum coccineum]
NMANENVPAPAPTRSDDQILPFNAWVPIRKSNYVLDLQKNQMNLIFQISVDILQNTNFFRAFTTSASIPALDEDWFILNANLLREALEITHIDQAHHFESPPSGDAIKDFVNAFGYPEEIHFMLWGIITRTNVDYAELMWEEFVQAIQTFFADKANQGIATKKDKKIKPHVIPYCRFTKLIICHLGRKHNINQRFGSPFNMAEGDHHIGNLKLVPKGEEDEVFGMQIPKELLMDNIRNATYYNAYLEMVAKHDRKTAVEEGGKKKSASKVDQSKKPATTKQPKPLVDEPDEEQAQPEPEPEPEPEPQGEEVDYDLQRGIQMSLESFQPPISGVAFYEPASGITHKLPTIEGKGKGIAIDEQVAQSLLELQTPKKTSTTDQYIFQRRILVTEEASTEPSSQPEDDTSANIARDTSSPTDAETDPGKTRESRPPPERVLIKEGQAGPNPGQSHVALAGPDPEPMHDDFVTTVYPQVHESLKHPDEEHVYMENPLSSTRTLSSMKNLDNFTFSDQFIADKSSEDELRNANMETKVDSMVTVPIHQASSSVPPLSTTVIDLSPPKPMSSSAQAPIFTTTTEITTTTQPPPPQQQSITDHVLASRIKGAVQIALQAPLRERFRDLSEADMNEILCNWMFESGSYIYQLEHVTFYEALEASMERGNRDELLAEKDKSRKRCQDDQDPPPPPIKESEQSKKKKHKYDASGSKQTLAQTFSAWKTSDTRNAPSSSSQQKTAPQSEQPADDIPIPNIGKSKLSKADLEGPAYKVVPDVSKPSPLGGPPGQTYERYGYTFFKEIVLRRADYKEYKISEADFKNLHPNDFEDLYLLHLQGNLNHLSGVDKVHLFNAVNLWIRNIVIKKRVRLHHCFQVEDDNLQRQKRLEEDDAGERGMKSIIWSEDDKRISKEFMEVIERRLKIRRIFRSLECFVSGRLRDVDYRLIQRTE